MPMEEGKKQQVEVIPPQWIPAPQRSLTLSWKLHSEHLSHSTSEVLDISFWLFDLGNTFTLISVF